MSPIADFTPPANPAALHQLVAGDKVAPHGWQTHVIRPGETLLGIALQHHTTTGVLVRRNHLPSSRLITAGTRIEVPRTAPAPQHRAAKHRHAKAPAKKARRGPARSTHGKAGHAKGNPAKTKHHRKATHRAKRPARTVRTLVVRPGETVSGIALRTHSSVAAIFKANGMTDGRQLWAGQRLRVPGPAKHQPHRARAAKQEHQKKAAHRARAKKAAARRAATRTVTVRPGDTVSGLALRLNVSQAAVRRAAGITDPHRLLAGQTIRLHGATRSATHHPKRATHAGSAHQKAAHKKRASRAAKKRARSRHNTFEGRTYSDRVVGSAARNRQTLASRHLPSRSETKALIARTARRHGVDPRLALAIAYQESGWSQRQVSVANAIGAMQVIPSTGDWASQMVGRRLDLLDPQDNVTAGVVVLRALLRSAADERQAIAGYYQGLAGVQRHGMYPDTRRYVANVLYHKSHL